MNRIDWRDIGLHGAAFVLMLLCLSILFVAVVVGAVGSIFVKER